MNAQDGYYGRPVLKEPVWTAMVPAYFFAGGLAGMSAALAFGARLAGNRQLARRALLVSLAGISASPPLLVADLGRPERFLNMLRVVKPTSPMSVGTWVLSAFGTALGGAVVAELLGGPLRAIGRIAEPAAALLGLPLSTYTAVLVSDTGVPAWHEARHELPFLFAGRSAASAGAAAAIITPPPPGQAGAPPGDIRRAGRAGRHGYDGAPAGCIRRRVSSRPGWPRRDSGEGADGRGRGPDGRGGPAPATDCPRRLPPARRLAGRALRGPRRWPRVGARDHRGADGD